MMKLFMKAGSCSLAPHIVLKESGLAFETEVVDLKAKQTASGGNYLDINPKGYVPALKLDSGEVLTEGPAITQYIADQVPQKRLAPANGTIERSRLQSWLTFIGTELHKNFSPFFNPAATQEWKDIARANLERRFAYADSQIAGRQFLMGDDFSVADAYLFTVMRWAVYIKMDMAAWPNLLAFQARVAGRPSVQSALKDEGLI